MTGFNIQDRSNTNGLQVFVSKYSHNDGSDNWFPVAPNFDDPSASHWYRKGWEVIVFRDPATGTRRGWYLNCADQIVNVTFFGFHQDIGLTRA